MTIPPAYQLSRIRVERGERVVLDLDSLTIPAGSVTAVVGANGAGKSTLLRVLALLETPAAGTLQLQGQRVALQGRGRTAQRQQVTYVAQAPLLLRRSVAANLAYGLRARGISDAARIERALARVGLAALASRPAWKLSGGEVQRVAIARALAIDPPIYLFDEPTANVDRQHVPVIEALLLELAAAGRTVVLSTHTLDQAYRVAGNLISLADGRAAPFPLVNLLHGATREEDGTNYFVSRQMRIELHGRPGASLVAIDPDSLIVAREPLHSSARNCVPATILRVERDDRGVLLTLDCGQPLLARITAHSYGELGLNVGEIVYAIFKSSAVHVVR